MGSLIAEKSKLYKEQYDAAVQMLKIFQRLSYEDKLRVIGITEGLLISQGGESLLTSMHDK